MYAKGGLHPWIQGHNRVIYDTMMEEDDSQLAEKTVVASIFTAAQYYSSHYEKQARRTSTLSGHSYVQELLYQGHTSIIQMIFRMPPYTLGKLQAWLFNPNPKFSKFRLFFDTPRDPYFHKFSYNQVTKWNRGYIL